ncbi:hypothetical protein EMEDMD4_790309 [Sinorhizobium medicae]|uniref:Uncharacterized protein n=1 Tax=Sinorhizobium medicae TaxID=110321 RepID=A0A508X600_9HYPH|nr:hypothetical protein EMEDMD4_790309 [Sinorhizobium medicae]
MAPEVWLGHPFPPVLPQVASVASRSQTVNSNFARPIAYDDLKAVEGTVRHECYSRAIFSTK